MVRLFIGGIPPNVERGELEQRFASFGIVTACDYASPKPQGHADFPAELRGFAYVELEPKDEAAIAKLLTVVSWDLGGLHDDSIA